MGNQVWDILNRFINQYIPEVCKSSRYNGDKMVDILKFTLFGAAVEAF